MKKKKVIALIISIILLISIGLTIYFLTKPNKANNGNSENLNVTKSDDNLILIRGGSFKMGSPESEKQRGEDEILHEVTLSDFYISPYEVTQEEYESIMNENPSELQNDKFPVESITWYEAIEYCNKLSEKENLTPVYKIDGENVTWDRSANGYRLPTEAEWEYIARAGTDTPFNTETSISPEESNYYGHYPYGIEENYFSQGKLETKPGEYRQTTVEVDNFKPNKWGIYNAHGNVREWVYDYYGEYSKDNNENPTGPTSGTLKVVRGGGWNDYAKHMRSAYRTSSVPTQGFSNTGFRIARNASVGDGNISSNFGTTVKIPRNAKILITYFSWGGNTEGVAEAIDKQIDADVIELELETPYSSNYNTVLDQAQKDMNSNARPKLKTKINNLDDYDVIMIGYPNWWATIPMPIATLLESYDFKGKIIIPFCSHGGGGLGQSVSDIAKLAPNSTIGHPLSIHYSGGSSLNSDVTEWLSLNGIK